MALPTGSKIWYLRTRSHFLGRDRSQDQDLSQLGSVQLVDLRTSIASFGSAAIRTCFSHKQTRAYTVLAHHHHSPQHQHRPTVRADYTTRDYTATPSPVMPGPLTPASNTPTKARRKSP
eukprot:COSAG01_NODE_26293_length_718_cov_1.746365_1_plen_119_part_00